MNPDEAAQSLLEAAREGAAPVFPDGADLETSKAGADLLVSAKLAKFADEGRTEIALTNAGRYWALHGGYLGFLKEEPAGGGGGRGRNPELEETRLTLMRLRLSTFWWSFGLSVAGFVISIVSLTVAFTIGGRLAP
ncbi:MAG: hypothetical protein AB7P07_05705 [Hyphomonadaceae bacterium]